MKPTKVAPAAVTASHADSQRDRILAAARRCYAAHGIVSTTMSDLASETGIGRATLYRYFRRREDVLLAVFGEEVQGFLQQFSQKTKAQVSFFDQLLALFEFSLHQAPRTPLHAQFFSDSSALWVTRTYLDDAPTLALTAELLRPAYERALAQGEIRAGLKLEDIVEHIGRLMMAMILVPTRHASRAALRRYLNDYLLQALRP